jgi:hypothetical protein
MNRIYDSIAFISGALQPQRAAVHAALHTTVDPVFQRASLSRPMNCGKTPQTPVSGNPNFFVPISDHSPDLRLSAEILRIDAENPISALSLAGR